MVEGYEGIRVLEKPMEVDIGTWAGEHLDCDTIVSWKQSEPVIIVYAFSESMEFNKVLSKYRDDVLSDMSILRGLPHEAAQGVWNVSEI